MSEDKALSGFIVTEKAMRPASHLKRCFYCRQPIGELHAEDCVLVNKKVTVRMIVEYEVEVPAFWEKENIEFHRNDSSWCADNGLEELQAYLKEEDHCMCSITKYEYVGNESVPFLDE